MKPLTLYALIIIILISGAQPQPARAYKKKVAQSGMTYLAISTSARLSAMGDASVAAVKGIDGIFYNPAVLADIEKFVGCLNQVNWLVDTKLYSMAVAFSFGKWGVFAQDLVYMDYGTFVGTRPVDTAIDYKGFEFTGNFSVKDFSLGYAYALRISDRFAFGAKFKYLHEDLGVASMKQIVRTDTVDVYKDWKQNHWGLDFGTIYYTGFKSLAFAMSLRNFSTDMKYWYEEFQLPICLRMGVFMDAADLFLPDNRDFNWNIALDAIHPNDYLERVHLGTELIYLGQYAIRGGYQFNHDVETFSLGGGFNFNFGNVKTTIDYAYTSAQFFADINRFSIHFTF